MNYKRDLVYFVSPDGFSIDVSNNIAKLTWSRDSTRLYNKVELTLCRQISFGRDFKNTRISYLK